MQNKEFWNKNWAAWEEDFKPSSFAEKACQIMKIRDLSSVLDLGCGKGRNSLYFAVNGMNVTALDISDEALETVKSLRHEKIRTMAGDIAKTDLGKNKYQAVFACLSLHYFDDRTTRRIMQNVHAALQNGGVFFIRCKSVKDRYYGQGTRIAEDIFKDDLTRHFFSPGYMRDVLVPFREIHITETQEDYFGPCAFVDAVAVKEE